MDKQQEYVLRAIEERDIRFVRLWFTDVLGQLKSVAIAPAEVEGAFEEGIGFDGSAIEGLTRVYESDMLLSPDPSTFQMLPWRDGADGVARMFCDVLTPDGESAGGPGASAGACRRRRIHLLHPSRDRVLPGQSGRERPYHPH